MRALCRTTRRTRINSTLPVRVLASTDASPDMAARAAATASAGSDFATPPADLSFGPVDLDDLDTLAVQVPGQASPIPAGPLDAHEDDLAEALQP